MRNDFCAFILTHGRPDRVDTYKTLQRSGYTGKIYIVIDDEDKTADEYRNRYGDKVLQFSKAEIAKTFDEGDNFQDRRVIVYARNACWQLAKQVGCRYFIQLDDDYTSFRYRFDVNYDFCGTSIRKTMDSVLESFLDYFDQCSAITTIAFSQGGDHMGGSGESVGQLKRPGLRRKAMNSFICSTDRPFQFFGRVNEDVNTYVTDGRQGRLFLTALQVMLTQQLTQSNKGGMTGQYLDNGTYIKSFYSVMYCPSAVKVGVLRDPARLRKPNSRLHHKINWSHVSPKILRENIKKDIVPTIHGSQ